MFSSIIDGDVTVVSVLICSIVSIILGVVISLTHKYTFNYTKNFLITLCVLPLLVESVIFAVNGNLGTSIATVGAFSLIRFRSMPGTSNEILVVFFAMVVGLVCGVGYIAFAILITIIGCLCLILFSKVKLFDINKEDKILKIVIPENLDYTDIFKDVFAKYASIYKLEKVKTINMGQLFELSYRLTLKKDINEKEFLDDIRIKNGNLKITLSEPISESEL